MHSFDQPSSGILRIFGVAPGTDVATSAAQLTRREEEVANLVAQGLSNATVARQLFLSPATVASHISPSWRSSASRPASRSRPGSWSGGCAGRPAGPPADPGSPMPRRLPGHPPTSVVRRFPRPGVRSPTPRGGQGPRARARIPRSRQPAAEPLPEPAPNPLAHVRSHLCAPWRAHP
ncbi:MAG TPA: helix-turn-helix transcriptional regulator [Candidatus Dormibacteraeota bacterium]